MTRILALARIVLTLAIPTTAGCGQAQTLDRPTHAPTGTPPPASTPNAATTPTPEPGVVQPAAGLWRDAVPPEAFETQRLMESAAIPQRDLIDLTLRLKDPGQPIPQAVRDEPWGFEIGDAHEFWVTNQDTQKYSQVAARLVYETPHTFIFVEQGVNLDEGKLKRLADRFEKHTYPTNRKFFGEEWSPGVDNDPHLTVLFAGNMRYHYQNSRDEFSRLVNRFSNEMEIFYISADGVRLDDPSGDCALAHEFQHVITWSVDPSEETWLFEGFSELACPINGLTAWYTDYISGEFAQQPDTQLNSWSSEPSQAPAQLGASHLFVSYFLDRFGEKATRALVAEQENGVDSVDAVLGSLDAGPGFDDVFADWVVANYINDPLLADGRYGYLNLNLPSFDSEAVHGVQDLPVERQTNVGQYAADYIVLQGEGNLQVDFAGATLVGLAPTPAHSGKYVWWSGRGTNSDTTLTREFDLTGLRQATLTFYTWYDIEKDFDYAYVEVSVDGKHWETLPGQTTTNNDQNGTNYGNGYTDASHGWVQETIDLTPFVGQRVQVRFEYVTDDGPVHAGIFLDDIEIPELSYHDDAESSEGGWVANGFIRNAIVMPQQWLVQMVKQQDDETTVERLQLHPDSTGSWKVHLGPDETAVLVVSGRTRVTTEPAEYWYMITALDD
jgi:immune inhibitor A